MKNKGKVNDCATIKTRVTKDNILFIKLKKILLNNTLWCWECQEDGAVEVNIHSGGVSTKNVSTFRVYLDNCD